MSSYSNDCIQNAQAWIDEIDDIDQFLDQLIEVNENCASSPSLDAFCASFSLNTTESLISSAMELSSFSRINSVPSEYLATMSTMSIPTDLSKLLISLSTERTEDSLCFDMSELAYNPTETPIGNFKTQEVSFQYKFAA
ncbi:hypothetical protein IC797_20845 (plasmid) [Acinetobacter seifertii]|jgi:hypothetical protein|uniref:hypothetical protein n=1 Tax=Acinetobacter seifertii TaxID=1530123 RepID=UPI00168CCC03|nr:hypothetical protein [Acinetobacter seifertii]QNX00306.1 hypothetical protein IC797_20845 [Acinetobacter seifertii]